MIGSTKTILLAEDDELLGETVALTLRYLNYEVTLAKTIAQAKIALEASAFHLGIFDIMLPGGDGFELARLARSHQRATSVLMLTARDAVTDKLFAFECGADDYLTKPFHTDELLARVKALLRRGESTKTQTRLQLEPWWVDLETGLALTRDGEIILTEKERLMLRLFVSKPQQVLSRDEILDAVWGTDEFPTDRTIDNFLVRLRRLFERDVTKPKRFLTMRSRGYLFRGESD